MPKGIKTEDEPLSDMEEDFCREYFVERARQGRGAKYRAAVLAGYSEKTASSSASRLLKRANVQKRLEQLRSEQMTKAGITVEKLLAQYAAWAFADPIAMFTRDGVLLSLDDMPPEARQLIQGFEVKEEVDMSSGEPEIRQLVKVKLVDRKGSLDQLAKWKDIFPAARSSTSSTTTLQTKDASGRVLPIDLKPEIVVNVLPPGFQFPKAQD